MKSMDIMVGDWVSCGGHYRKIQSLEFDNTEEEKCWFWSDEDQALCLLSEHDPIPLTAEILEKNGFELKQNVWVLAGDKWRIYIQYSDKWSIDIRNEIAQKDDLGRADLVTFVRDWAASFCVHELQHALRLCGIDKEIEL